MTSLVLGAAGALVGSYIPGVGAAMGWMLGSAVGGMFAATGHVQDGPRLGDTKIQVSTYGKPIPLVYGKMRISGNIIWAQPIKETAHKHKVKVSPFKKIKYYTYTYSCSFAVSLCNTQISGISRIWADGKLIYDMASTNSAINAASAALKANMRIYLGTETQMPDALLGGDTAYRGQTYVVFENLQLEKYSNRIPMLEFEVCALSTISASIESANRLRITEILAGQQNGVAFNSTSNIVLDNNIIYLKSPQNGAIYQFSVDNPITPGYLGLYNPYPNETSPGQRAGGDSFNVIDGIIYSTRMDIDFTGTLPNTGLYYSQPYYPYTTYITIDERIIPMYDEYLSNIYASGSCKFHVKDRTLYAIFSAAGTLKIYVINLDSYTIINKHELIPTLASSISTVSDIFELNNHILIPVQGSTLATAGGILALNLANPLSLTLSNEIFPTLNGGLSYSIAISGNYVYQYYASGYLSIYDYTNPLLPIEISNTNIGYVLNTYRLSIEGNYLFIGNINDFITDAFVVVNISNPLLPTISTVVSKSSIYGATNYVTGTSFIINGTLVAINYDSIYGHVDTIESLYFTDGRVASTKPTVASIISDITNRVGVTDIDTSLLSDSCSGYVLGTQMSARAALEPLQQAYFIDSIESDSNIVFKNRDIFPVEILDENIDIIQSNNTSSFELTRGSEVELPAKLNTSYYNTDNSYVIGMQTSTKQVTISTMALDVSLPIALSDSEAKRITEVNMRNIWSSINIVKFNSTRKYDFLNTGDLVTVNRENGSTVDVLITKRTDNIDGSLTFEGKIEDSSIYTQAIPAASTVLNSVLQTVDIPSPTNLLLLDIPLLRDIDDNVGFYFAAAGTGTGWTGGVLLVSSDNGATFSSLDTFNIPGSTLGYSISVLGDYFGGNTVDQLNKVSIYLSNGDISSITLTDVLNGGNLALLGREIIKFTNATLTDTNTYELSGIIRGLYGTEQYMSTHITGESFTLLNSTNIQRSVSTIANINLARRYLGASMDYNYPDNPLTQLFTNTGVSLKPLSPVQIGGGRDTAGNLTINWVRRGRLNASWNNFIDVPLGETTESYSIDIMSGTTVIRTLTSITPSVTYSAANQVTDFGSTQSEVLINIYQISSTVGRGFAGIKTI